MRRRPTGCTTRPIAIPTHAARAGKARVLLVIVIVATVVVVVCAIGLYQLASHIPTPTRNFTAEMNTEIDALPSEDIAWPGYIGLVRDFGEIPAAITGLGGPNEFDAREALEEARPWLAEQTEALARLRSLAARPHLGMRLSDGEDPDLLAAEAAASGEDPAAARANATPPAENPAFMAVLLPQLGKLRGFARVLRADLRAAVQDGDGARASEDLVAMAGLAEHANEPSVLIGSLVSIAITSLAVDEAGHALARRPDLFTDDHLAQIAAAYRPLLETPPLRSGFGGERLFFQDVLQRVFTGGGRGKIAPRALAWFHAYSSGRGNLGERPEDAPIAAAIPYLPLAVFGPTGRDTKSEVDAFYDAAETLVGLPVAQREDTDAARVIERLDTSGTRNIVLVSMLPSVTRAIAASDTCRGNLHGLLAAIELERYRLREGSYPASLGDVGMSPAPIDVISGEPLRYRRDADGSIVLYSVGIDRDDDGGRPPEDVTTATPLTRTTSDTADGDWVLYPPVASDD